MRRAVRLPPDAAGRRAARRHRPGIGGDGRLPPAGGEGGAARRRDLAVRRLAAVGRRGDPGARQVQPHPRYRHGQPLRRRPARRHQPGDQRGGEGGGVLLRPRPVEPDRLFDRRQRGGERRGRALPEIRPDHQQPARPRDGAARRRGDPVGRQTPRSRRSRPAGGGDRIGRPARHHHRGHGAPAAAPAGRPRFADGVPVQRGGGGLRGGDHRRGDHSGRAGDDGQARHRRCGSLCPCGLPARRSRRC